MHRLQISKSQVLLVRGVLDKSMTLIGKTQHLSLKIMSSFILSLKFAILFRIYIYTKSQEDHFRKNDLIVFESGKVSVSLL